MPVLVIKEEERRNIKIKNNPPRLITPKMRGYGESGEKASATANGSECLDANRNQAAADRQADPRPQTLPIYPITKSDKTVADLVDIGAYLTNPAFDRAVMPSILERASKAGVKYIVVLGVNLSSSRSALKLCDEFDGKYSGVQLRCVVGVGPTHATSTICKTDSEGQYLFGGPTFYRQLEELIYTKLGRKYVVGIGECGLDYSGTKNNETERVSQRKVLRKQMELAEKLGLPVVLRTREAYPDLVTVIKPYLAKVKCVVGSYDGPIKPLNELLEAGVYIGLNGGCTNRKGFDLNIMNETPWNRCMVGSAAPFQVPRNIKIVRRDKYLNNEPCSISFVVKRLAELDDQSYEAAAAYTSKAAMKFFGLGQVGKTTENGERGSEDSQDPAALVYRSL